MSAAHAAGLLVALGLLVGPRAPVAAAPPAPPAPAYPVRHAVTLDPLWSGLPPLSGLAHAGDDRVFLTLLDGRVLVYQAGSVREEPYLDLRELVSTGGEHGLLGLAFHPRHRENGLLFVSYNDAEHSIVIARYREAADGAHADAGSAVTLLAIRGYASGHSSAQLHFGPDGYLYASIGGAPLGGDPQCGGQRLDVLHGKILRLDVDSAAGGPPYYATPPTNPYASGPAPEVWAYGLRNPWRFSFDRATGDLYVADVGENRREEVHRQPAASPGGENYGWGRMEGSWCANLVTPCQEPVPPCGDAEFTPPILEHEHDGRFCAVIGGYVYRGSEIPELEGRYVYGDHCSGRLFAATAAPSGWTTEEIGIEVPRLSSFGEDAAGEIHLVTTSGLLARLSAWPGRSATGPCVPGEEQLCLGGGRYRVAARWRDGRGGSGAARAVSLTPDAGYFWFLHPSNVELVVKLLAGCRAGMAADWFFAAGLTDVEVDLRVLDVAADRERVYAHQGGSPFPSVQDTSAFPCE